MKLAEIATEITKHLKRFEADPVINARNRQWGTVPYYHTHANAAGRFVQVCYVSYQGTSSLTKPQAEAYLEWLNQGNVGPHWRVPERASK